MYQKFYTNIYIEIYTNYIWIYINIDCRYGLILYCICMNFYFVFAIDDYASHLSTALTLFTELLLISLVAHDIFVSKGYKNWYFLESFRNEVEKQAIKDYKKTIKSKLYERNNDKK